MLEQITPLILTYDEAPNIGRTLERLQWAQDIVVLDSFSDDQTLEIISQFPNARVFQRAFDDFASQWNFGLTETGISTDWVLGIDADFLLTDDSIDELRSLNPPAGIDGYKAPLTYCIHGHQLRSGLLPPLTVLYRRAASRFSADGHTYGVLFKGEVGMLRSHILHDDRKPLSRWLEAQQKYAELEGRKLLASDSHELSFPDRIRRLRIVAPLAIMVHCLIFRGGVLDGWPGFYYAFQRAVAELVLSLYLLEQDLGDSDFKLRTSEFEDPEHIGAQIAGSTPESSRFEIHNPKSEVRSP
jgi:glycosyltransferase involved in cell wall biosynthesis